MEEIAPVAPPLDASSLSEAGDVIFAALGVARDAWSGYIEAVIGAGNVRALRVGGRVAAGLCRIPGGQWFHGRSLRMMGIAAVGVAAEHRGRRLAARLCADALREMAAEGVPLATLYASSLRVYRSVGFEPAGTRNMYRIAAEHLPSFERDLPVARVPATAASLGAFRAVDAALCARAAGRIDRGEQFWARLLRSRTDPLHAFIAGDPAAPEGYAIFSQPPSDTPPLYDLDVREVAAATPRALRRLVTLLADHRSFAKEVRWPGPAREPLLSLLPEERAATRRISCFLLRIADVGAALLGRGYAPHVAAEVALEVTDATLPANEGRYALRVEGGRASLERGALSRGSAAAAEAIRLDVRALAPLFTGYLDARALALLGMLEGPERALDAAGAIFAGPEPWMPDMF